MVNDGLYADGCIWINESLPTCKKYSTLAEEIGHHETTAGNILNQDDISNRKQELTARKRAYEKILPVKDIEVALKDGYRQIWELAEHLDVDEDFMREALKFYGMLDA